MATALCAVPLLLFGGSVTTLGAGMAVEGWLIAEGDFLLVFPVEKWFRDLPTFVEHTHRLFGVLVGICAVATVFFAWREGLRPRQRLSCVAGLLAVCAQGAIGGFRVLENSLELAFLHGALAQAVFAGLCAVAWSVRPRATAPANPEAGASWGLALASCVAVYGQIVLGAWYRHGVRPEPVAGAGERLVWHLMGALFVLAVLTAFAHQLGRSGLDAQRRRIHALLGVQLLLGFASWVGYRPGSVGVLEWAFTILHVLVGALLLASVTCATLDVLRAAPRVSSRTRTAEGTL